MNMQQHRQTWDLIPWLVNGTASAADRAQAESHLAVCADCRDEYAFQSRLRAGLGIDARADTACEAGLAHLLSRIDAEESGRSIDARPRTTQKWLLRSLAAAVVLQAIGLAALLWPMHSAPLPAYRTLSATPASPVSAVVRLVPSPELSLGRLQRILGENGLRIVEANDGATILALAPAVDRSAPAAPIDAVIEQLRRTPGVLLAEPIGTAAGAR